MPVSVKDWQKNKARTLLREPLTDALKVHQAAAKKFLTTTPATLETMSAYLGANKTLQAVVQKTSGMCLPKVHDDTKKYLAGMDAELKGTYKAVQQMQVEFNQQLKVFQQKRSAAIKAIEPVVTGSSTPASVQKAADATEDILKFMQQQLKRGYASEEITRGIKAVSATMAAFEKILKLNEEANKKNPGRPLPLNPGQLSGPINDIKKMVSNLKTIGGFYPPKTKEVDALKHISMD